MQTQETLFLNRDQLAELTGYCRRKEQSRSLLELGIPHKIRRDGVPLVLREVVHREFGLQPRASTDKSEPDIEALRQLHGE